MNPANAHCYSKPYDGHQKERNEVRGRREVCGGEELEGFYKTSTGISRSSRKHRCRYWQCEKNDQAALIFVKDSRKQIYEAVEERVFQRALTLEIRAALRLLAGSPDLINRLRYHLTGGQLAKGNSVPSPSWTRVDDKEVVSHYFQPLPNFHSAAGAAAKDDTISFSTSCAYFFPTVEFSSLPRSGFPLSAHPLLRRLHPDFDGATGYDYDPYSMRKLEMRWNYTLFLQERVEALKLVKHSY
eukprot:XP_028343909.1 uncharacterized protein LOC114486022 [Physeter catodon]